MADEPAAENLDEQPEEEEGGPVKSFLEHLEDLRWVLIKSGVAAGVAMLGCLLGRQLRRPGPGMAADPGAGAPCLQDADREGGPRHQPTERPANHHQ